MKYILAIFDLDGTILDTLEDLTDSVNHALTVCGYPTRTIDEVRSFVGNGIRKLICRCLPEDTQESETDRVHRIFAEYYKLHCADKTAPYTGVCTMLRRLREAGVLTAVLSNKADFAVQPLVEQYFPGLFDMAAGERPGVPRKPSPDGVRDILKRLAVQTSEAVYIGDSDVDLATARNAGMACISVDWGFRDREFLIGHGADGIVSSPEEIAEMILE